MGYHVIDPTDLESTPDRPCTRWSISAAADLENFAINVYEAEPGEQIPLDYHRHTTQEEALYVLAGTMSVQTPAGRAVVETDQAFIAEPGSPHRAYNPDEAEHTLRVLAMGAPQAEDAEVYDP